MTPRDDLTARARAHLLQALGGLRARRAGFYREYLGLRLTHQSRSYCEATMLAGPEAYGPEGCAAPGALASLADAALGTAVRQQIGPTERLATFGLTLQVANPCPADRIRARAEALSVEERWGVAQCRMTDGRGELLATATGSFSHQPGGGVGAWQPPSRDGVLESLSYPAVDPAELIESELKLLEHVEKSVKWDDPDGPYTGYLGIAWRKRGGGTSAGLWKLGPHLWNRARQVHGGAMFGGLAAAVLACLPDDAKGRIVEQYVQFVRPGTGEELQLQAGLLRHGRHLIAVEAEVLDAEGRIAARALATLEGLTE